MRQSFNGPRLGGHCSRDFPEFRRFRRRRVGSAGSIGAVGSGRAGWYQKQKQDEKKKAKEAEEKANEKPVVGGDNSANPNGQEPTFSQLSKATPPPPAPHLLFDKRGLTDSTSLDYGDMIQSGGIGGPTLSAQYAMGWWWTPDLVLSGFARVEGDLASQWLYVDFALGPQLRYFTAKHWTFTLNLGWGVSKGLSRTDTSHIPIPSDSALLDALNGPTEGLQIAYLFWKKRDLAWGPSLNLWLSQQGDRSASLITVGITFQSGRPDYTGDVTER